MNTNTLLAAAAPQLKRAGAIGAVIVAFFVGQSPAVAWERPAGQAPITYYSGRATVLDATANITTAIAHVVLSDTGELEPTGLRKEDTVATLDNPQPIEIHSKTATATTEGANDVATSSAEVQTLYLNLANGGLVITADVLEAHTSATWHGDSSTVSTDGGSLIANLTINGQPIATADRPPNTSIDIPGVGRVIINEQYHPDVNTIAVNALHIIIAGAPGIVTGDVVVSHAQSGFVPPSGTPPPSGNPAAADPRASDSSAAQASPAGGAMPLPLLIFALLAGLRLLREKQMGSDPN